VSALAALADSAMAVSGGADGTVKVWDLDRRQLLRTIEAHGAEVTSLAVSSGTTLTTFYADYLTPSVFSGFWGHVTENA
jgi:WD40 repeat protein